MTIPYCDIINGSTIYIHAPTTIFFGTKIMGTTNGLRPSPTNYDPKGLGLGIESP
jgi:hypothetical protein